MLSDLTLLPALTVNRASKIDRATPGGWHGVCKRYRR